MNSISNLNIFRRIDLFLKPIFHFVYMVKNDVERMYDLFFYNLHTNTF